MDALLRRHFWLVDVIAIGLCAAVLGHAGAGAVEGLLPMSLPPVARAAPAPRPAPARDKGTAAIVGRNVFCSDCRAGERVQPPPDPTPQRTRLPLDLVAINVAADPAVAAWSSAVLRDREARWVGGFGVGATVRGATITAIHPRRVDLSHDGKAEYLNLLDGEGPREGPPPAAAAVAEPPPAAAADPLARTLARGIRKTGEGRYEIQRATLEEVLANLNGLSQSARIFPEQKQGRGAGFRLVAVKPDGAFARIGLQSGDLVSAINGLELTSIEKALELFAKLRSAGHLSVDLERGGRRLTQSYVVR